ncbi:MAG: A/G-specific adenine glycosylase [Rhodospirillaceae bacterium]|nr:A/G-specific adenine glycosylase [Rhodospirillaceae bacterium]MBT5038517.1 A/G-specific adenine glycosylase [Rhodospirillaceae bacterium]MBT6828612.1 A/G-specific adenine glycosylase [Rhodospirillaceae bacterium]
MTSTWPAEKRVAKNWPAAKLAAKLLAWYDAERRDLPWRAPPGQRMAPYPVWLSEIMLQQTTVATVAPYFEEFLRRWPELGDLAAAPLDDVLHAWQGLGYYARARNMLRCAQEVVEQHGGVFPEEEAALLRLPGIGPYTAAAIAAIAFDRPATILDGNVERVIARLRFVEMPLPAAKPELHGLASEITPIKRPGDYAQAIMDLGATICTPRKPACARCPWQGACLAYAAGASETLPRRMPKPERPLRHGIAFWAARGDGQILLRRRPEKGLLGGLMEVPTSEWRDTPWQSNSARRQAPGKTRWRALPGVVSHGFTHFRLEITVFTGKLDGRAGVDGVWCPPARFADHALSTLSKKIIRHAISGS